ncbi:MAG: hypothetical protein LC672_03835, partial [Acidobacteria bacterium]|nr:hypothetical protein [Acidobacteriota bacterium]
IQANRQQVFVTPVYQVIRLYSEHTGAERLAIKTESPTFDTTREGKNVPFLDAVASRSADGKRIYIKLVNTDQSRPLPTAVELEGASVKNPAEIKTVTTHARDRTNSFQTPNAIDARSGQYRTSRGRFSVVLPKHSVSVITLNLM